MGGAAYPSIGRRQFVRADLCMVARFNVLGVSHKVELMSLSVGGARIICSQPAEFTAGTLHWLQYQAFAEVAWSTDCRTGLSFPDPLDRKVLSETQLYVTAANANPPGFAKLAAAWVHGPGDW